MTRRLCVLSFILFLCATAASAQVTFTDVTEAAGFGGLTAETASNATWGDYDNDGDVDVFFSGTSRRSLYRNEGNGGFLDVTEAVGIDASFAANAALFVDFDNDGNLDLFVGGGGSLGDVLYRNKGDGTFLDISQTAGMESKARPHGTISFDYNNDGLLDIYAVGNWEGTTFLPNLLYHNEGNGRFKEIAAQIGLDKPELLSGEIALGDYDNDGDLDLLSRVLYRNEGGGKFIDVTQQAGIQSYACHNLFFWDYDNDGELDIFIQGHLFDTLYRNNGDGTFTDVTQHANIAPAKEHCAGAYYGDYDNDGWLDLCITYDENSPTLLYHNNGDGTFMEVSKAVGIGGVNSGIVSFLDYDNDGDLDIFTSARVGNRVALYRNEGTANQWLRLKLVGSQSNRDAIGARVKVVAGGLPMFREIAGSSAYRGSAQDRLPLHFGLGKNLQVDLIEIHWPSGMVQTFTNIVAGQRLTIDELEGILVIVREVFPLLGDSKGGTPVQIQGEQFLPGSRVFFGGVEARDVRVFSSSLMTAVTPPGAIGLVNVEVVLPDGKRRVLKNGFRYATLQVTKITPESGPVTGGVTVQIEGFGFQVGAQVLIGGKSLLNAFVTPALIRGTLPSGTPGAVDVLVTNPDGERDVLRRAFTYISSPTIEDVSPLFVSLGGGNEIQIEGSGFIRTPSVQIGGVAAQSVVFISSSELNIRTPRLFDVGPQDAVVVNPDGQRAVLPGALTVLAPIEIKSVEPKSGGLAGGTKITIIGEPTVEFVGRSYPSRFVEAVEVFIGDVEADKVTVQSDHVITAITPPNTSGPKDVEVTNPDGQSDFLSDAFIYNPFPQIQKVIPDNGRLAGGTKITIHGSGFLPGAKVLIRIDERNFVVASSVQFVSDTLITAMTPEAPGDEPGSMDLVVRNPDRQEAILQGGFTYNPLPTIESISPNYGPASGGAKVILKGTGFLQGARVFIGKSAATTEVKDNSTIEAVTSATPQGVWDVSVQNPDTQEAVKQKGFISVGEVAYNYPNPFRAPRGTTFRYVTNERVESISVNIFNLAGVPIDVVGQTGTNEVRWQNASVHAGLYVYLMEVTLEGGKVKKFKRALEVYK